MKLTRDDKKQIVGELKDAIEDHQVVGILDMHSLPAKQLQQIRKELSDQATIRMSRKTLMHVALDEADKDGIEGLKDNTAVQPAFIFSQSNPFTLYKTIQNKKSSAPASGGEIAPNDIVIDEGDTGIGPGPMIGMLQRLGAQTSVEDGSIKVTESSVAVEEGEVIDDETAEILNKLDMKPLKVGLDLKLVHEDGEVFDKDVLSIDEEAYMQDVEAASARAFNLAVNAGYLTKRTAETVLVERFREMRNLAVNAAILDPDVIEDLLSKASSAATSLDAELDLESAEIDETEEEEDEEAEQADEGSEEESEEGSGEEEEPAESQEADEAEEADEEAEKEETDDENDTTSSNDTEDVSEEEAENKEQ